MGNRAHTTCKSLCRPSLARPSPSRLKPATPLMPSRLRSRTRKESLQTSSVSSSPASSSRTAARSRITTSRRSPPCILFWPLSVGKKRKKKTYTKPKKIKRKKKNVKLAILKCYKVDDDGKVTRLRRVSPSNPGRFMATHFDRQTCGATGLTYMMGNQKDSTK